MDEIHWWQFPLSKLSIKLDKVFKNKFFEKVYKERAKSLDFAALINKKSKFYNKSWNFTRQRSMLWKYKKELDFIPAWIIYELAKYLKVKLLKIEKHIIAYSSYYGRIKVTCPNLPIKVTPLVSSFLTHLMCDGCVSKASVSYFQKDKNHLIRFIKIVKEIFGSCKSNYKKNYYMPLLFGYIISKYYKTYNYGTYVTEIPHKLKNQPKQFKVAILASALLDDGYSCSCVQFLSASKKFINDLEQIMKSLDYKCTNIRYNGSVYIIKISVESLELFYKDLTELFDEYPLLYIGRKYEEIKKLINIKNRGWKRRNKFETKNIILNCLKQGPKRAIELRGKVNVSLWTVYHHLQQLVKLGRVKRKSISKREFIYELI